MHSCIRHAFIIIHCYSFTYYSFNCFDLINIVHDPSAHQFYFVIYHEKALSCLQIKLEKKRAIMALVRSPEYHVNQEYSSGLTLI